MANTRIKSVLLAGTIIGSSLALASAAGAQTSASPYTSAQRFDAAGRVTGTISADPDGTGPLPFRATRNSYDAAGRLTKVERGTLSAWQSDTVAPSSWSGFTLFETQDISYDALGRKTKETLSGSAGIEALTQYSYDAAGRLDCTAVRMNKAAFGSVPASACSLGSQGSFGPDRITKNTHDAAGQLTKVTEAWDTPVQADEVTNSYTLNGKLQTLTDAENNRTTYEYDGHDRLAKTLFPVTTPKGAGESNANDYEQYGYDPNGNRTSFRNRGYQTLYFSFDALNRMTLKDLPGTEPDITYGYDLLGRMTSASQPNHALSFTYDALGRKLTEAGPDGTVRSYWDKGGRRTQLNYPDGFAVSYVYLDTGEMKEIRQPGTFSSTLLLSFGYDNLGRRTSIGRASTAATSYSYDPVSRLSQLVQNPYGTTHDLTLGFSYNPASQIVQNTRSNNTYSWTGHGNGTTGSSVNGLNQLTSQGSASIGHDAKGNTTNDPTIGYTYGYSSENLLTSVVVNGNTGTLSYDPLMRLYDAGTVGKSRFVYDGETRIAEYYSSGVQTYRFVHGPGVDEPLIEYSGTNLATRRFLHADERGSIIAGSDDAGTVTGINRYDEYGKPASANFSRFQFTGQPYETLSELYYYRARMYNPRTGVRFMQVDPFGYVDGPNMYTYVNGDPLNRVDPRGEDGYLVSRPTYQGYGPNHMFVVVADGLGRNELARYSYGPDHSAYGGGNLVSLSGTGTPTDVADVEAWQALRNPAAAAEAGITFSVITASDAAIMVAGDLVDFTLGTPGNPGEVSYAPFTNPLSNENFGNSNSAAYAVAQDAGQMENGGYRQPLPPDSNPIGWGQYKNIDNHKRGGPQ